MKKLMVRIAQLKNTPSGQLFIKMGEDIGRAVLRQLVELSMSPSTDL